MISTASEPVAEAPAQTKPLLLQALSVALGGFVASRVLLLLIGVLSRLYAELPGAPVDLWVQWDSRWYLDIVQNGYSDTPYVDGEMMGQANFAFFPAYPLLASLLARAMPPVWASLLLSNLCFIAASALLYVHAAARFDARTARMAVLSLSFFPGSFVFSSVMTESLFVLVTLGAYHFARERRHGLGAAFGFVACATRATGVFLALGVVLDWLRARAARGWRDTDWRELLVLGLAPLGLVAYMAFLYGRFEDAFAFQGVQTFWYRHPQNPISLLTRELTRGAPHLRYAAGFTVLAVVGLVAAGRKVLTLGEWVFVAVALLAPLSTGMDSMPRYVLGLFPVHLVLGALMARREAFGQYLLPCMGLLNGFLMSHWSRGHNAFF
jgi:hypothetical protein